MFTSQFNLTPTKLPHLRFCFSTKSSVHCTAECLNSVPALRRRYTISKHQTQIPAQQNGITSPCPDGWRVAPASLLAWDRLFPIVPDLSSHLAARWKRNAARGEQHLLVTLPAAFSSGQHWHGRNGKFISARNILVEGHMERQRCKGCLNAGRKMGTRAVTHNLQ